MDKLGAVILAAGRSSRMGGFKPLLPLGDSTIIETVIGKLSQGGVSEIVVVTGRESDKLQSHLFRSGIRFVENREYASTDMFHSAKMGLSTIAGRAEKTFFMPADIPLFHFSTLVKMNDCLDETEADIVIPTHGGRRGHPILIRNSLIPKLISYGGQGGLRGAITLCGSVVSVEVGDRGILLDADTPEDYALICSMAEAAASLALIAN